jgi:hypothetical protein
LGCQDAVCIACIGFQFRSAAGGGGAALPLHVSFSCPDGTGDMHAAIFLTDTVISQQEKHVLTTGYVVVKSPYVVVKSL